MLGNMGSVDWEVVNRERKGRLRSLARPEGKGKSIEYSEKI